MPRRRLELLLLFSTQERNPYGVHPSRLQLSTPANTAGLARTMISKKRVGLTATLRRLSLSALMLPLGAEDATEFSLQHTGATYGAGTTKVEVQWDHTS